MHNIVDTTVFSHDLTQVSFSEDYNNNSPEVPLEETREEQSGSLNVDLTENPEDILSNEFFEKEDGPLYPVTLEMSFNNWAKLDK
jgi:hypothetical protein